jgi:hypothetical protein
MMLVGCAGYSYIIGSLSSIFSASDTKSAQVHEKLLKLS